MSAFDPIVFDPSAFDAGSAETLIGTGVASCGLSISIEGIGAASPLRLAISVVSPLVFTSGQHSLRWSPTVHIGTTDVSTRLSGRISIQAAEDAGGIASFSVTPVAPSDMDAYEGQAVTIDVTLFAPTGTGTYRLFTGVVEGRSFSPQARVVDIACRDGWQERPKACADAASVEALFGGLAAPCAQLVPWSVDQPDPAGYFTALLDTMAGATAVDSSGLWRAIPWVIGAAEASFGAQDVFDASVTVNEPNRADVPADIMARLNFRYARLHAVEVNLSWEQFDRSRFLVDGLPVLPKERVLQALSSVSGWLIKGAPNIVQPIPGSYPIVAGGTTVYYNINWFEAQTICQSMTATLYRRWYQEVDTAYSVTIDMGGASNRDDSISLSMASTFDGAEWEKAPTAAASSGIYLANAPPPLLGSPVTLTGYEGLPAPHPAANSSMEWHPDVTPADLNLAATHLVALAVRRAAKGKRKRTVEFSRPLDPRWEIGSILAIDAYGVSALGQVVERSHDLDLDSGDAASRFKIACPNGDSSTTAFSASVMPPNEVVPYMVPAPVLGNHIGASVETPARPNEEQLTGFLCNVLPDRANYDPAKPVYEPQFRIILPPIGQAVRDPVKREQPISAAISIATGSLSITF